MKSDVMLSCFAFFPVRDAKHFVTNYNRGVWSLSVYTVHYTLTCSGVMQVTTLKVFSFFSFVMIKKTEFLNAEPVCV